ncbi:MAG: phosphatase PAP2 family protein [Myxococcales bacterium]|nr:phosphatase PAP2 family protein [Myxococcales bacterium]
MKLKLLFFLVLSTTAARAEPVRWDHPRFRPAEYVTTGAFAATLTAEILFLEQNLNGPSGGVLFDEAVTDAATLGSRSARDGAVAVGDAGFYSLMAFPVLDATVGVGAAHQSPDAAAQMLLIDAQAFAISGTISVGTQKLVGRKRPFLEHCAGDPSFDKDCDQLEAQSQSFLSGHTIIAFTGAGLGCAHHLNLDIYGSVADPLTCALGLGVATWVGTSRIVSSRHYLSDVLSGAALGLGSGWLMPTLLHYRTPLPTPTESSIVVPWVAGETLGVEWLGRL